MSQVSKVVRFDLGFVPLIMKYLIDELNFDASPGGYGGNTTGSN